MLQKLPTLLFFHQHDDGCTADFLSQHLAELRALNYDTIVFECDKNCTDIIADIRKRKFAAETNLKLFYSETGYNENDLLNMTYTNLSIYLDTHKQSLVRAFRTTAAVLAHYFLCLPGYRRLYQFLLIAHSEQFQIRGIEDYNFQESYETNILATYDFVTINQRTRSHFKNLEALAKQNNVIALIGVAHFKGIKQLMATSPFSTLANNNQMHFLHSMKDICKDVQYKRQEEEELPRWFWHESSRYKVFPLRVVNLAGGFDSFKLLETIKDAIARNHSVYRAFTLAGKIPASKIVREKSNDLVPK